MSVRIVWDLDEVKTAAPGTPAFAALLRQIEEFLTLAWNAVGPGELDGHFVVHQLRPDDAEAPDASDALDELKARLTTLKEKEGVA
jgi:hypothetical protein